jgi:hypothetical protein
MPETKLKSLLVDLAACRKALGPYTALQNINDAYRCNDAAIARVIVRVSQVVEDLVHEVELLMIHR